MPGAIGEGGIESIEPFFDSATEDDVEVGGRTSVDAEAELHRRSTFDDERVGTVVVADVGEQLATDLQLGIDGFTLTAVLNGHIPGRVTLLGQTAAKVVAAGVEHT